jgi:hypothetical protein
LNTKLALSLRFETKFEEGLERLKAQVLDHAEIGNKVKWCVEITVSYSLEEKASPKEPSLGGHRVSRRLLCFQLYIREVFCYTNVED